MGLRLPSGSAGFAALALFCACVVGCGAILGIDPGKLKGDASSDALVDATTGEGGAGQGDDAPDGSTVDATTDGGGAGEAGNDATGSGPDAGVDACRSDPNWCNTRCGTSVDNCGQTRNCPLDCPTGTMCNAQNQCGCTQQANWCNGRCQKTTDNCGGPIDCGTCEAGTCTSNVCGCTPESDTVACNNGQQTCGQATNNCNLTVNCGVQNTPNCPGGQVCVNNACCTPNNGAACGTKCNTSVTNNCGQPTQCPSTICPSGQVCYGTSCCTPDNATACANKCGGAIVTNNCGQMVACNGSCGSGQECSGGSCCSPTSNCGGMCNTSVADSCGVLQSCSCTSPAKCTSTTGPGTCCTFTGCTGPCMSNCGSDSSCCPPDSGGCSQAGGPCPTPSCCAGNLYCASVGGGGNGTCITMACIGQGLTCMGSLPCCYPWHCMPGVVVTAAGIDATVSAPAGTSLPTPAPSGSGPDGSGPPPDGGLLGMTCQ